MTTTHERNASRTSRLQRLISARRRVWSSDLVPASGPLRSISKHSRLREHSETRSHVSPIEQRLSRRAHRELDVSTETRPRRPRGVSLGTGARTAVSARRGAAVGEGDSSFAGATGAQAGLLCGCPGGTSPLRAPDSRARRFPAIDGRPQR